MRFYKQLMIDRIMKSGDRDMIAMLDTNEVRETMKAIDGKEVQVNNWRRMVYDEPVYYVVGDDGEGHYVNERDCK